MNLYRIQLGIILVLCIIAGVILFSVKDNVQTLRSSLSEVKKQVRLEQDTIHILKAELAYLSAPERLRKLSENYLGLKSTKVSQVIKDPLAEDLKYAHTKSDNKQKRIYAKSIKWRYKRGNAKYITTVSDNAR